MSFTEKIKLKTKKIKFNQSSSLNSSSFFQPWVYNCIVGYHQAGYNLKGYTLSFERASDLAFIFIDLVKV